MLKCDITKEKNTSVIIASGSTSEIVIELGALIHHLYTGMANQNEDGAVAFRRMMISFLTEPDGPIWRLDDAENKGE